MRGREGQEGSVQRTRAPSAGLGPRRTQGLGRAGRGAVGGGQAEHRAPSGSRKQRPEAACRVPFSPSTHPARVGGLPGKGAVGPWPGSGGEARRAGSVGGGGAYGLRRGWGSAWVKAWLKGRGRQRAVVWPGAGVRSSRSA